MFVIMLFIVGCVSKQIIDYTKSVLDIGSFEIVLIDKQAKHRNYRVYFVNEEITIPAYISFHTCQFFCFFIFLLSWPSKRKRKKETST